MTTTKSETERQRLVQELLRGVEADALSGRLLRTREVALLFEVSERAVTDWATRGRIPSIRTPGGHRRYPADAVARLLLDEQRGL
ncbi:MAG: helix-turn-helix domain-containing protein [Acidimicrobiales bacterium]|nr:helix-turn-helix domain-containing protein [Acidimicrobiales bacterium]